MQMGFWPLSVITVYSKALNLAFKPFSMLWVLFVSSSRHTLLNFHHLTFLNCSNAPRSTVPQCLCTDVPSTQNPPFTAYCLAPMTMSPYMVKQTSQM